MTDETLVPPADLPDDRAERRKLWLTRLAIAVAVAALLWLVWWFLFERGYVSTDNAYVGADSAQITPLVSGAIKEARVSNTQMVQKGAVLLVIDDADLRIELANARAAYDQAVQRFNQARATNTSLSAQLSAQAANIAQARANYDKARDAAARREALAGTGAVSAEELETVRAQLAEARAAWEQANAGQQQARGQLSVNEVVTRGYTVATSPDVAAARARVAAAELNLSRTVLRAPISGVVTQKQVQVGQRLQAGTVAMTIVPIDAGFVDANFKEGQLRHVRAGQPVELTSDFYGSGVVYHGVVQGFAGGTGSAFALIPAQNATGNWVKVVQRLPVRIRLDSRELRQHPLRVGLSMDVVVNTREP